MPRAQSTAADKWLDRPIQVLDHGFVTLIDYMGDDSAIARAARNSYGKGTRSVSDDRALIRRLVRDHHTSPLEMAEIKLHLRMPIFVARQHLRHRTASLNEYSGRYSEMPDLHYVPDATHVQKQHATNRQGRGDDATADDADFVRRTIEMSDAAAYASYRALLHVGTARELARVVLPLSAYTEMTWKIDLHNLLHFLRLRMALDAQMEIRVYANAIANIVRDWVPLVWGAFEDYRLHAVTLSAADAALLRDWLAGKRTDPRDDPMRHNMSKTEATAFMERWAAK